MGLERVIKRLCQVGHTVSKAIKRMQSGTHVSSSSYIMSTRWRKGAILSFKRCENPSCSDSFSIHFFHFSIFFFFPFVFYSVSSRKLNQISLDQLTFPFTDMSSQEAIMSMCEDQIRVTIIYTVKEVKGWLVPSAHEGEDGFYLHEIDMPDSIFDFSACICHLLSQEGSEKFVHDTLSRIPSVSAQEWKTDIAPEVYAATQNALKTGCNSRIDFLLETNTYEYWPLQETSAGEEWESLNGQTQGFGAVSATDYEIMMALRSKVFRKEMDHNSEYDCAICLEEFVEDIQVYQMPCLHFFHGQCIVKWLRRSNCCPYCRFRLQ